MEERSFPGAFGWRELSERDQREAVLRYLRQPGEDPAKALRVMGIFAHPDDEVLAMGGRLKQLPCLRLLCVTDGAPKNGEDARRNGFADVSSYRDRRRSELDAALRTAGLPENVSRPLNLSREQAALVQAADQETALHLASVTRSIARQMEEFRPEVVLTHPYEGGHPDHDGCAFAVHTARGLLRTASSPVLVEAPFYHAAANGGIETGCFLEPVGEQDRGRSAPVLCELSLQEQKSKREQLGCFSTQRETLAQFATDREQFRIAPTYDFLKPAHTGQLFYEKFQWGMSGIHFVELARAALAELRFRAADIEAETR